MPHGQQLARGLEEELGQRPEVVGSRCSSRKNTPPPRLPRGRPCTGLLVELGVAGNYHLYRALLVDSQSEQELLAAHLLALDLSTEELLALDLSAEDLFARGHLLALDLFAAVPAGRRHLGQDRQKHSGPDRDRCYGHRYEERRTVAALACRKPCQPVAERVSFAEVSYSFAAVSYCAVEVPPCEVAIESGRGFEQPHYGPEALPPGRLGHGRVAAATSVDLGSGACRRHGLLWPLANCFFLCLCRPFPFR